MVQKNDLLNLVNKLSDRVAIEESRLQKVETRNLQLAGTGERLMISNGYNRHNARSPVPARKNLLFAGDSEDVMEKLLLLAKIEKGCQEADAGKTITHSEAERRMAKWLK